MKTSIIIPMYNAEKHIIECLDALKKQTNKDFEVIVIDDGSKDDSFNLVKNYKGLDLKIFKQENSGPAKARNLGAFKSKGEIILFVDSDCVPEKDFVDEMIKPFKDKKVSGVQGEYKTKNSGKMTARYVGYEIYYRHEKMKKKNIDHIATYAAAYRRKDFGKGFSEDFKKANMEDTEFSYNLSKQGKKLVFAENAFCFHPHPEKLWKFLKQQYGRGYWRALGHKKHKDKLVKDSYMGNSMMIQGGLSLMFFLSLILSIIFMFFYGLWVFVFPLGLFVLLVLSNLGFGIYCSKFEKKMFFLSPLIASLRSLAGTLGFLKGVVYFKLFK